MVAIHLGAISRTKHWARALSVAVVLVVAGCSASAATPTGTGGQVAITSHADGVTVASADIVVQGTAPAGAQITRAIKSALDDHATADASGAWSMPVRLTKGSNELAFRIGSDNSSAVTIHVVFDPLFTPTPSSSPTSSPTAVSESPVASNADSDDEPASSAGASFAPNATGVLPPTSGAVAAERLPGEPDPALTPGTLNPAVSQATIGSTICVSGWTATVRPSSSFTTALKIKQIVQYGYSDTQTSAYEEDHLISLELGGAPADARNLWPEPYTVTLADGRSTGARTKDGFETKLKNQVCAGSITLAQAQSEIGIHWVHAYYAIAVAAAPTAVLATKAPVVVPPPAPTAKPPAQPATAAPVAPAPTVDPVADAKAKGATAICADGTLSFSKTRSGTCSKSGGVHWWTGNVGAAGPGAH